LSEQLPQPSGGGWQTWANRLTQHLKRTRNLLGYKIDDERATEDGLIMWDTTYEWPTVSKNGTWRQIVLADGEANFVKTSTVTAATANTGYPITFDTPVGNHGISQGTPASRIVFEEGGHYMLAFSAQIASSSGSTVNFWFWPVINGVVIDGTSSMNATLHQNHATTVVSRTAIFDIEASDYLEVYWAVDSTNGTLKVQPATSFAPATPSVTLAITRIHG
jgi:hypothetical protein